MLQQRQTEGLKLLCSRVLRLAWLSLQPSQTSTRQSSSRGTFNKLRTTTVHERVDGRWQQPQPRAGTEDIVQQVGYAARMQCTAFILADLLARIDTGGVRASQTPSVGVLMSRVATAIDATAGAKRSTRAWRARETIDKLANGSG
jgi:hypothetical protein